MGLSARVRPGTAAGVAFVSLFLSLLLAAVVTTRSGALLPGLAVLAFAIQWAAFLPAAALRTERFFDLVGSVTFVTLITTAAIWTWLDGALTWRGTLVALAVVAWAVRLGTFLVQRVLRQGGDRRFDELKERPARFFLAWTAQGLWTFLTPLAALVVIAGGHPVGVQWTDALGLLIWAGGFALEVQADEQKRAFRADPANEGRFIQTGLWAWSRHPNYFGEIVLWIGLAIVGAGVFEGGEWAAMISPVVVFVLLTRVSGVPLLEAQAWQRWGEDPEYAAYVRATSVLLPVPPTRRG